MSHPLILQLCLSAYVYGSFAVSAAELPRGEFSVEDGCSAGSLWPSTFSMNDDFESNFTFCIWAPQIPSAIQRLLNQIGPLQISLENTGSLGSGSLRLSYDISVCQPTCVSYCTGILAPQDSVDCPDTALLPLATAGPDRNNYTLVARLYLQALPADSAAGAVAVVAGLDPPTASYDVSIVQNCAGTPPTSIDRTWCARQPYGALDVWSDPLSEFYAPLYAGVSGCDMNPAECGPGGSPGTPCCLPGFGRISNSSSPTSCGNRCYNCSTLCVPLPSPSSTASSSPSAIASVSTRPSNSSAASPSRSGAHSTGSSQLLLPVLLAVAAGILTAWQT